MKELKIFCPATVANVSCGFDILGLAVDNLGDTMTFKKTVEKDIKITKITGADLPYDIEQNAVGAVIKAMLKVHPVDFGIEITMHKGYKPGSGLGSSASSSAGAAFGVNQLLGNVFSDLELTKLAMLGEEATCGTQIADNVAACIYGGFVLVKSYNPLNIVRLPVPDELRVVVLHPEVEIKTKDARDVLPKEIPLKDAVFQWGNVAGLISGLHTSDYTLIGNSLQDIIVEPYRKKLIPHFDEVKNNVLENGALGSGISGSGPSIFAICKGDETMNKLYNSMQEIYANKGIDYTVIASKINTEGIKILTSN